MGTAPLTGHTTNHNFMQEKHIHFGDQQVSPQEKTEKVNAVFDSVASNYDVMNDVMSLGVHRLWKRYFVHIANARAHHQILDLAAGTGDITALLAPRLDSHGSITLCDPNAAMLEHGRQRLIDRGLLKNIHYIRASAESLPFKENYFDCVTLAFGLRNFTNKAQALRAIFTLLKPGGQLLILEFSKPQKWMQGMYAAYSFKLLPRLGKLIAKDAASYQYLAESIRKHPDQQTLQSMVEAAGFEQCSFNDLSGGIVSIHRGYKLSI